MDILHHHTVDPSFRKLKWNCQVGKMHLFLIGMLQAVMSCFFFHTSTESENKKTKNNRSAKWQHKMFGIDLPQSSAKHGRSVIQHENPQHLFPNPVDPILPFVFLLFYLFIIKHYVCNCLKAIHYIRRHSRCLRRKAENGVWITLWSVFTQLSGAFILWWGTTTQMWTPFVSSIV